jgi:hypothetical protein
MIFSGNSAYMDNAVQKIATIQGAAAPFFSVGDTWMNRPGQN